MRQCDVSMYMTQYCKKKKLVILNGIKEELYGSFCDDVLWSRRKGNFYEGYTWEKSCVSFSIKHLKWLKDTKVPCVCENKLRESKTIACTSASRAVIGGCCDLVF